MGRNTTRFFDQATVEIAAGDGGDGMVHFHREKFVPKGGPDGGDGGHGGSVYFVTDPHLNTLLPFQQKRRFIAQHGQRGGSSNKSGKYGKDLIVKVPVGTVVRNIETGKIIADLAELGEKVLVAKGGQGGRGNQHFANSRRKTPYIAEKGDPGVSFEAELELKLVADVGIVGVPNAGKSTFLSVVSAAKPKIANYPFTTLVPNLGVADLGSYQTMVLADIPGLIEGAHQGVGLGFEFLRHVQRTRVLIHMLDGWSADPLLDFNKIMTELALFDEDLADKPQVVVLNKIDMPDVAEKIPALEAAFKEQGYTLMTISAIAHQGIREVLFKAHDLLKDAPDPIKFEPTPTYSPVEAPDWFEVEEEEPGIFRVRGERVERAARMTYWEHGDAVRYFQRILEAIGVHKALRTAGIENGDTVVIDDYELEWIE